MSAYLDEIDKKYWMMVHPYDTIGNVGPSDISVCCPICNEGGSWMRKHRLHLYIKPSYDNAAVKCFNCGYSTNLYCYLKENHPNEFTLYSNEKKGAGLKTLKDLFNNKNVQDVQDAQEEKVDISGISTGLDFSAPIIEKDELQEYYEPDNEGHEEKALSAKEIASFGSGLDFSTPPLLFKEKDKPLPDKDGLFLIDPVKGFTKMPKDAIEYIRNRGLEPKEDWLYSPLKNKIKFNGTEQVLSEYIIIPFTKGNKWYGFQALAWKQKRFFVFMVTGNSGHKAWNFYNIDKDKPVYITESIYDSMSLCKDNVIAQLGANLSDELLNELKDPIFILDNFHIDETAYNETTKYAEKGYKIFIWPENIPENIKDFNDIKKLKISPEKINKLIDNNIFQGMTALLKLKLHRI